jgi:hypothetical protein
MFVPGNITTDMLARIINQDPTGRDYVHRVQAVTGTDSNGNPVVLGDMADLMATGEMVQPFGYQPPAGIPADTQAQADLVNMQARQDDLAFNASRPMQAPPAYQLEPIPFMNPADDTAPGREPPTLRRPVESGQPAWLEQELDALAAGGAPAPGGYQPWGSGATPPEGYQPWGSGATPPEGSQPWGSGGATSDPSSNAWPEGSPAMDPFVDGNLSFPNGPSAPPPAQRPASGTAPTSSSSPDGAVPGAEGDVPGVDPDTGTRTDEARAMSLMERILGPEDSDRRRETGRALMAAGATIMSTGGSLGESIGAGIKAGLVTYDEAMRALKDEEMAMRELEMKEEAHAIEMAAAELALERARAMPVGGGGPISGGATGGADGLSGDLGQLYSTDAMRGVAAEAQDLMTLASIHGVQMSEQEAMNRVLGDRGYYLRGPDAPEDASWADGLTE